MNGWCVHHVDSVHAFSQANCNTDMYLLLLPKFHMKGNLENYNYHIKLKKNLYGVYQASANWFIMLRQELL